MYIVILYMRTFSLYNESTICVIVHDGQLRQTAVVDKVWRVCAFSPSERHGTLPLISDNINLSSKIILYSSLFTTSGSNNMKQKHVEKYKREEKEEKTLVNFVEYFHTRCANKNSLSPNCSSL